MAGEFDMRRMQEEAVRRAREMQTRARFPQQDEKRQDDGFFLIPKQVFQKASGGRLRFLIEGAGVRFRRLFRLWRRFWC